MNITQLKKNIGWWMQLSPPAVGIGHAPAFWHLAEVDEKARLIELKYATGHVLKLGGDHIRSFMSDPNRDTAVKHHGILQLEVQVFVEPRVVRIEPIRRGAGRAPRSISPETTQEMIKILGSTLPDRIAFASIAGDAEAHGFKSKLIEVFQLAGWRVVDAGTFMFFNPRKGIVLTIPLHTSETGLSQVVAKALSQTSSPVTGNRGDMANPYGMYVQVWHAH